MLTYFLFPESRHLQTWPGAALRDLRPCACMMLCMSDSLSISDCARPTYNRFSKSAKVLSCVMKESIVLLHRASPLRRCIIFQRVGAIVSKCASVRHVRAAQRCDRLSRAFASAYFRSMYSSRTCEGATLGSPLGFFSWLLTASCAARTPPKKKEEDARYMKSVCADSVAASETCGTCLPTCK